MAETTTACTAADADRVFGDGGGTSSRAAKATTRWSAAPATTRCTANQGADEIVGGAGNDTLWALAFADVPLPGVDTLRGESGSDTFRTRDGEPDLIDCGEGRRTAR